MKQYVCFVCGNIQRKVFLYRGFHYYRCINCGQMSTYPFPGKEEIVAHYRAKFKKGNYQLLKAYDDLYKTVYLNFADILESVFSREKKSIKGKKILDVGCFTGDFLQILQERGADVRGLELQSEAVKIANQRLHGRVRRADVMNTKFSNEKFDAITLLGLVEHVTDPKRLLQKCSSLLKKGGILMIQTPNSSSFFAKTLQQYWPPYEPVEHIHLFSRKSLELAIQKQNFRPVIFSQSWKKLPVPYVFNMMQTYGPEFYNLLRPFSFFFTTILSKAVFSFYVGEMVVIAKKE